MGGMSNKVATALTAIIIGATLLMCLCYAVIFVQPEILFNPYRPSYAETRIAITAQSLNPTPIVNIPTKENTPIYGPTWTPTMTPTPSITPTPTETRTPTPTSTLTPTATPFPTKTPTPLPPPTATPLPPPTATQAPPLFTFFNIRTEANCHVVRIMGKVFNVNGVPLAGVTMQVGESGVVGSVFNTAPTDANGRYIWDFGAPDDNTHTWFVVPLNSGVTPFQFTTDHIDTCEIVSSVQIVSVDWRRRAD